MDRYRMMMFASYLQIRVYITVLLAVVAISVSVDFIIGVSVGFENYKYISFANMFALILLSVGIVLPLNLFKKVMNLGATRREYYVCLILIYALSAAGVALFNVIWLMFEIVVFRSFIENFNILEIFRWHEYGWIGMLFYQFAVYMLILSLLNLLCSGLYRLSGWFLWMILIAAIPVGIAVPAFRPAVVDGLTSMMMNESMIYGFALMLALSALLLLFGWFFIRRRPV